MPHTSLLKRLEAATEGSRELDAEICAVTLGCESPTEGMKYYNPEPEAVDWVGYDLRVIAKPFTTSIDAALTLVPEGWPCQFRVHRKSTLPRQHNNWAQITPPKHYEGEVWTGSHNAGLPLAITIAALKARAR